jgi:hypothetical protein
MRRIIVLLAIAVLTVLVFAPPAGAMPKEAQEWDQWCDLDGDGSLETYFAVTGDHLVGWALPWGPGDSVSGGIFMGDDHAARRLDHRGGRRASSGPRLEGHEVRRVHGVPGRSHVPRRSCLDLLPTGCDELVSRSWAARSA